MNDVTRVLSAIERGDHATAAELLPLVYDELRRLAADRLAGEARGQTLQATAAMADVPDSKSGPRKGVWVQVPPSVLRTCGDSQRFVN
jgi:hypothetical protein